MRSLLPVRKIFLPCLLQRDAADKKRARGTTDSVRACARDHATHHITPAGKKLQHGSATFTQKHSCADVCAERRREFCRSAEASLSTADVHDARDHHHLKRGEDRHVCQRDRLRANCRANRGRRLYQHLCDMMLRFAIARNSDHFDFRLVWEFLCQNGQQPARFSGMHVGELNDLQQTIADRWLRFQNFSQLCNALFRSEANPDDFGVRQRSANVMLEMQQDIGGFAGCWFFKTRFPLVEKEYDVGRLTFEIFFDLSYGGIGCVTSIQDGNRSMPGYVPIDPSMHWHQSNIQLLWRAGCKKRVDDSVGRRFARSDEEEPRRAL